MSLSRPDGANPGESAPGSYVGETYVEVRGEGKTVLLLHGNPDSCRLWDAVTPLLEDRCRCLAPDLPGFGRSRLAQPQALTLEDHAAWVDGLLQGLGVEEPVHLVVHDFGGPYGLAWAVRHPERVASVLACDTIFMSDYRWHFWARVWRTPLLGELAMPLMGWHFFRFEVRRGSPEIDEEHLRRTFELVTPAVKRAVLRLYRATDPEVFKDWEDELRALLGRVPSLALWGERDPYIAPRWAHALGAREVVVVPECGHWLPVEAPELVARRILELVAEGASGEVSRGAGVRG